MAKIPPFAQEHLERAARKCGWSLSDPAALAAAASLEFEAVPINGGFVAIDEKVLDQYTDLRGLQDRKVLPFYFCQVTKTVFAMASAPWDVSTRDVVLVMNLRPKEVRLFHADESFISQTLQHYILKRTGEIRGAADAAQEQQDRQQIYVRTDTNDQGIWGEISRLMTRCVADRASDLHLQLDGEKWLARSMVNGEMRTIKEYPMDQGRSMMMIILSRAGMQQAQMLHAQDGSMAAELEDGSRMDVRVASAPCHSLTKDLQNHITLRFQVSQHIAQFTLENLFEGDDYYDIVSAITSVGALCLISGPTSSGKTVTLGACLRKLNTPDRNIYTIEDPVENIIPGVTSISVGNQFGFGDAIVSILRKAPNVIMVGEIRDSATAGLTLTAALTGHIVLTTLHTQNCITIPSRLCMTLGVPPDQAAEQLRLVSSQRLLPILCEHCSHEHAISEEERRLNDLPKELVGRTVRQRDSAGCGHCRKGLLGRKSIIEILKLDGTMRRLVAARKWDEFQTAAMESMGNRLLQAQAVTMLLAGKVDISGIRSCLTFGEEWEFAKKVINL